MDHNPAKVLLALFAAAFLIVAVAALVTTMEWKPIAVAELVDPPH
jgi:hypothetical protein